MKFTLGFSASSNECRKKKNFSRYKTNGLLIRTLFEWNVLLTFETLKFTCYSSFFNVRISWPLVCPASKTIVRLKRIIYFSWGKMYVFNIHRPVATNGLGLAQPTLRIPKKLNFLYFPIQNNFFRRWDHPKPTLEYLASYGPEHTMKANLSILISFLFGEISNKFETSEIKNLKNHVTVPPKNESAIIQ